MNDVRNSTAPEQRPTDGRESGVRRFFAFVENFWYHHKFGTLVTIFLVIVLLVCTLQMCGKNTYDAHILYAGPWFDCAGASRVSAIESAFRQFMDDFNGDGQKTVAYRPIWIMNEAQIQELKDKYKDNPEEAPYVNTTLLAQNSDLLQSELMTGEAVICLLDPTIFYGLYKENWMVDISGFVPAEYIPENPYNNYGVFLKDTAFGEYFSGISEMPEDTVLCFRRTSMLTDAWLPDEEKAKVEEYCKELFTRILAFRAPSEENSNNTNNGGENNVPPEKT